MAVMQLTASQWAPLGGMTVVESEGWQCKLLLNIWLANINCVWTDISTIIREPRNARRNAAMAKPNQAMWANVTRCACDNAFMSAKSTNSWDYQSVSMCLFPLLFGESYSAAKIATLTPMGFWVRKQPMATPNSWPVPANCKRYPNGRFLRLGCLLRAFLGKRERQGSALCVERELYPYSTYPRAGSDLAVFCDN